MIDRYTLTASSSTLHARFQADVLASYSPTYNAAPTHLLPIILQTTPHGVSTFYWGTSPEWSKNKALSEKIITVGSEAIPDKVTLKKALMKFRCLIPADGFYAWKRVGKKTAIPYRFVVTDQDCFSMAGLWEEFEDSDGNQIHTFRIITTVANATVAAVQERMPAILTPASEKIWMNTESDEASLLKQLEPYAAAKMSFYPVSPRIHDSNVNFPSLILPTAPADQFGNLTLFD